MISEPWACFRIIQAVPYSMKRVYASNASTFHFWHGYSSGTWKTLILQQLTTNVISCNREVWKFAPNLLAASSFFTRSTEYLPCQHRSLLHGNISLKVAESDPPVAVSETNTDLWACTSCWLLHSTVKDASMFVLFLFLGCSIFVCYF